MGEFILINDKKYVFIKNYKDNYKIRSSFNKIIEKTYGFNLESWYNLDYWGDKYIPYSLLNNDKVVANVSVNIMDFTILGEEKRYVQIGTVMTDENYRRQGLSRTLIEMVLKEWENKCQGIYLYANNSVLNFYPKFGFSVCSEYQYSLDEIKKEKSFEEMKKMDIRKIEDREFVYNIICNSKALSKVHMNNNPSLIMFYCINFMNENIYYIKDYNTLALCDFNEEVMYLYDVFTTKEIELGKIINIVMNEKTKKVVLGFTPNNTSKYKKALVQEEDTTLFIKMKENNPFKTDHIMFPILSHS